MLFVCILQIGFHDIKSWMSFTFKLPGVKSVATGCKSYELSTVAVIKKFRTWLKPLYILFCEKVCWDLKAGWGYSGVCCVLCFILSCSLSSDLPLDSVALGTLHASPLPASPHRLELLPALNRKGQLQPRPGKRWGLVTSVFSSNAWFYSATVCNKLNW